MSHILKCPALMCHLPGSFPVITASAISSRDRRDSEGLASRHSLNSSSTFSASAGGSSLDQEKAECGVGKGENELLRDKLELHALPPHHRAAYPLA